ncbi:MAG: hypothetical protein OEV40_03185 [Acidimicrobiia bacterium]|nr:hypothetical protein [Acidimicrobiia bacterium]
MASTVTATRSRALSDIGRRFLSTTPGRLRVESLAIVAAALVAGILASLVVADHGSSAQRITDEAEPVIVSARQVQTSLAEANAAAATAFLAGGVENPTQRQNYEEAMAAAATELERATRLTGDDEEAHDALRIMTAALPRYAGLIEAARANNRQGFPVGAAYLESASTLLEEEIYPATDLVANRAAARYRSSYDRQRGLAMVLGLVAIALIIVVLLMLVYVQFQLRRRFNRTLNVPILAGSVIALALAGWMASGLASQLTHLTAARTDGYEGTRLYLDVRGTGFGAKADEARFLIARGAGEGFEDDFTQRALILTEMEGDLDQHAADSARRGEAQQRVDDTYSAWLTYAATHEQVVEADRSGDRDLAVELALGDADTAFADFDAVTAAALDDNQTRFITEMELAERAMRGLRIGSLLAVALIAGLALYGLQLRINEYR